eukprot:GFUD01108194.1.p1 GENE.GFUD01108194.1~~GFUD01108194.1.p1  ORF type:complete len:205 (-),score=46.87 GFUD01108194.1:50-664(-)
MDSPRHNSCRPIYALLAISLLWIFWPVLSPAMLGLNYIAFLPINLLFIFCSTIGESVLFVISLGCFGFLIKDAIFKYGDISSVLRTSVGGNITIVVKIAEESVSEEVTRPVEGNDDQEEIAENPPQDCSEEVQSLTEEVMKGLEEDISAQISNSDKITERKSPVDEMTAVLIGDIIDDNDEILDDDDDDDARIPDVAAAVAPAC